ncbi:MAG TPA: hypothetical protein PK941_07850 [Paludibacter sp.]|nr:hypothetical protein [Paludibacter sp.]
MKASLLKETLKLLMKARVSAFIWGPPGCGKSSIVNQISEEIKKTLYEMRALLYEPIDVRGFPKIEDGRTIYCPPEDLPTGMNALLFIDELNLAPLMTQNSFLQLVIPPHKLGSYELPTDCGIIAAGNRETDRVGATRMGTSLANRFVHLNMDVDNDEWLDWAIENGIAPEICAFIKYRGDLLMTFDPKKNEKAFASPRSYEFLSNIVNEGLGELPRNAQLEIAAGTIGEGPATEFIAFTDIWRSLPVIEDVLKNPSGFPIPEKPAVLFALCGALSRKATPKTADKFFEFANRLSGEWSVRIVNDAIKIEPKLKATKSYINWASRNVNNMI